MNLARLFFVVALVVGLNAPTARAEDPAPFDPRSLRDDVLGRPTEIFVLATPHLSDFEGFDPSSLEPLLERLAAFRPSVVAIESLSGETLNTLQTYEAVYPEVASQFGGRAKSLGDLAAAELRLAPPAAEAEVRRTLSAPSFGSTAPERRRLAALMAAAHDPASALVQWLRLPPAERRAGDGVSPELAGALDAYALRRNEIVLVAARLAVRLGLERLHPVDDQTEADVALSRMADLEAAWPRITEASHNPASERIKATTARAAEPDALLDAYRELNTPASGALDVDGQWRPLLRLDLPRDTGRRRVIQWETRNLRMAANLREASAEAPGGRVLLIVGSAHKPWLDAYLSRMHDVVVIDAATVLGPSR